MEIGTSQRAMIGQSRCGDSFSVLRGENVTIVVADGLGHGPKAEEASVAFCDFVSNHQSLGLEQIISGASKSISGTRGTVAAIVRIDEGENTMLFSGIGNIEVHSITTEAIRPICMPGIIGRRLRKTKQFSYRLNRGDVLVLFSDGISGRFQLSDYKHLDAQEMADTILTNHGKNHDDATCVVIKY